MDLGLVLRELRSRNIEQQLRRCASLHPILDGTVSKIQGLASGLFRSPSLRNRIRIHE